MNSESRIQNSEADRPAVQVSPPWRAQPLPVLRQHRDRMLRARVELDHLSPAMAEALAERPSSHVAQDLLAVRYNVEHLEYLPDWVRALWSLCMAIEDKEHQAARLCVACGEAL